MRKPEKENRTRNEKDNLILFAEIRFEQLV
jgi:hypothetical protein